MHLVLIHVSALTKILIIPHSQSGIILIPGAFSDCSDARIDIIHRRTVVHSSWILIHYIESQAAWPLEELAILNIAIEVEMLAVTRTDI